MSLDRFAKQDHIGDGLDKVDNYGDATAHLRVAAIRV